ncbi:CorA metal ion transporter [Orbilia ellipsospora]|uniref:CorA metal ion transporter n=1 Tax=Orbilia ellipsospora TaxID=2528407 RepID=A0AAV9XRL2_9PEZI
MAGSVDSLDDSAGSSSSSSSSSSARRTTNPVRRHPHGRDRSKLPRQSTSQPSTSPSQPHHQYQLESEPPLPSRSPQSRRRRRRRNTLTARRASVMVDHDDDLLVSNEALDSAVIDAETGPAVPSTSTSTARRSSSFYQLNIPRHRNLSSTSVDSVGLLDHREQKYTRPRRSSTMGLGDLSRSHRHHHNTHGYFQDYTPDESAPELRRGPTGDYLSDNEEPQETQPLISRTVHMSTGDHYNNLHHTAGHATERTTLFSARSNNRPASISSHSSNGSKKRLKPHQLLGLPAYGSVNFPPSVPGSPNLGPYSAGLPYSADESVSPGGRRGSLLRNPMLEDHIIDIDGNTRDQQQATFLGGTPPSPSPGILRQRTVGMGEAEEDVCFPVSDRLTDGMGTPPRRGENGSIRNGRRRRAREWPDLRVFEEWSREEKEERITAAGGNRVRQVSEPVYVGGRLRPTLHGWHREVEDLPYRFTYFNDELGATIHAQTISELVTPGETTFRDLFMPPPRRLETSSDEESGDEEMLVDFGESDKGTATPRGLGNGNGNGNGRVSGSIRGNSVRSSVGGSVRGSEDISELSMPSVINSTLPLKHTLTKETQATTLGGEEGERPTWWLDVLSPTKAEMKVFQDAFGIHPLTAEDILMQEPREKVELFRNYYLVSYRTFEQDPNDEEYMEPVNFYIVVFRTGVLTFHFSMTPHSANVRRRIRQLKDYIDITADWISYALIDNITDAFGPIIQMIEEECDEIDDIILADVETTNDKNTQSKANKVPTSFDRRNSILATLRPSTAEKDDAATTNEHQDDASMLRRIATCRKKVMGLYRLMGNKADVIKGFSKRCNEHWEVAPRSEIGLYLGDIQDHIVTMVANLVHVEKILSRGHSNYLAQISIKMNERQEETADTLGRLTVLGTIVLPMNIVTGLWGMNVLVPGQGVEDSLAWFWCITAGLFMFGILCYFVAKRVYGIV